jgi:hypothetical protein
LYLFEQAPPVSARGRLHATTAALGALAREFRTGPATQFGRPTAKGAVVAVAVAIAAAAASAAITALNLGAPTSIVPARP